MKRSICYCRVKTLSKKKFMKTWLTFAIVFLFAVTPFSGMVSAGSNEENCYAENTLLTTAGQMNADENIELSFDFLKPAFGKNRG